MPVRPGSPVGGWCRGRTDRRALLWPPARALPTPSDAERVEHREHKRGWHAVRAEQLPADTAQNHRAWPVPKPEPHTTSRNSERSKILTNSIHGWNADRVHIVQRQRSIAPKQSEQDLPT